MKVLLVLLFGVAIGYKLGTWVHRTSIRVIKHYIKKKGYTLPTDEELEACTKEVVKHILTDGF